MNDRRTKRRRSTRTAAMSPRLTRLKRIVTRGILNSRESTMLNVFPIWIALVLLTNDAYVWQHVLFSPWDFNLFVSGEDGADSMERAGGDAFKRVFQGLGYAIALLLILGRLKEVLAFFLRERGLAVLVVVLTTSTFFASEFIGRGLASLTHLLFGLLATWLVCQLPAFRTDPGNFSARLAIAALLPTLILSVFLFFAQADVGLTGVERGLRYGGLTGHPNTLGIVGTVMVWASAVLLFFDRTSSAKLKVFLLIPLCTAITVLVITDSATSQVLAGASVLALVAGKFYFGLQRKFQALTIAVTATVLAVVLYVVAIGGVAETLAQTATESVGRDASLTGRTDLWEVAVDAFHERPLLGWGYDYHDTAFADPRYFIPYRQYHNGYLDNLVNGGLVLGAALIFIGWLHVRRSISIGSIIGRNKLFPLQVVIVAGLVHNFTEYSMFRPNNTIWTFWTLSYMAIAVIYVHSTSRVSHTLRQPVRPRGSSRRTRRLSW